MSLWTDPACGQRVLLDAFASTCTVLGEIPFGAVIGDRKTDNNLASTTDGFHIGSIPCSISRRSHALVERLVVTFQESSNAIVVYL